MSYHTKGNASQKSTGFVFVVIFHLVLIWGLAEGLKHHAGDTIINIIKTKVVEEVKKPDEEPPPPPPPEKLPPPDFVPPPDFTIDTAPAATNTITQVTSKAEPVVVAPVVQCAAKFLKPPPQPEYPPSSQRLGEEGSSELSILIGEDGRVSDAQLVTSSTHEKLDAAAIVYAKRSFKFVPCIQNGKPTAFWAKKKVTWKLEDAKR